MFKRIVKITIAFLVILLTLVLGGCWDSKNLKNVELVVAMGVDYVAEKAEKQVTVEILKPDQALAAGTGESSRLVSANGSSVLGAIQELYAKGVKELSLPHNRLLIIGKSAGEHNIGDYLDYFVRSYHVRPSTLLVLANSDASELLTTPEKAAKTNSAGILTVLNQKERIQENLFAVSLQDFVYAENATGLDPILPLVEMAESSTGDDKEINLNRFAIFKQGKVCGFLTPEESQGYLWLQNGKNPFNLGLELPNLLDDQKGLVSVDIIDKQSQFEIRIDSGVPVVQIRLKVKAGIRETASPLGKVDAASEITADQLKALEKNLSNKIADEIGMSFRKSQELASDFLGIGQHIYGYQPKMWSEIKQKQYLDLCELDVQVQSEIVFLGDIAKPLAQNAGKEG